MQILGESYVMRWYLLLSQCDSVSAATSLTGPRSVDTEAVVAPAPHPLGRPMTAANQSNRIRPGIVTEANRTVMVGLKVRSRDHANHHMFVA
jgi:hypothetical protein